MVEVAEQVESAELAEFRLRAREWLAANAEKVKPAKPGEEPDDPMAAAMSGGADMIANAKAFQRKLADAGFAGITFPNEYGGAGLSNDHQRVWNEESAEYDIPSGVFGIGLGMCAPTILTHGTEELKKRYLPKLLSGEEIWCQLFSEPGAGSDVASLQTRALQSGDVWVVNGQKVWTSGAQYCDFGIINARTDVDVPKHNGITMFIVDMHAKGVTVKPLRQITGGASFNEVFFDEARIPHDHVVGEINDGWRVSITTLMNERVSIGAGGAAGRQAGEQSSYGPAAALVRTAQRRGVNGDPVVRQELMRYYIGSRILSFVGQRIAAQVKAGITPGPEGSIAKLAGALLSKQSAVLDAAMAGASSVAWESDAKRGDRFAQSVLSYPSSGIAGGTNEIMRNIIGERVLGLPREPHVDRDVAFKDIKVGTQR